MSQASRLLLKLRRNEEFRQRAEENRRRLEERQRERFASASLNVNYNGQQQVQPGQGSSNDDFGTELSFIKRRRDRNSYNDDIGNKERDNEKPSSSVTDGIVISSVSDNQRDIKHFVPRRVYFSEKTGSILTLKHESPASSISVSQSPIKPSNEATAARERRHCSERDMSQPPSPSRMASIDEKIEKWTSEIEQQQHDSQSHRETNQQKQDASVVPDLPENKQNGTTGFEDNCNYMEEDYMEKYAREMKEQARLREQAAAQLKQFVFSTSKEHDQIGPRMTKATLNSPSSSSNSVDRNATSKRPPANAQTTIDIEASTPSDDKERSRRITEAPVVRCASAKDLWDDSDEDDIATKQSSDRTKNRKRQNQTKGTDRSLASTVEEFEDDRETLESQLKPEFSHPKFGPFESTPIVLLSKEENECNMVPASMSRYLPTYQRKGIEFLHSALTAGTGAILGDEMGLGKTVQIIGLLSALLRKTGTGLDLLELKRRRQLVAKARTQFESVKDRAIMTGSPLPDKNAMVRLSNLPPWAPILLLVPAAVFENWLNEFQVWGHFAVAPYSGKGRPEKLEDVKAGASEILLCGASLFLKENDFDLLNEVDWKLVIIDEFHSFKNTDATVSRHLRSMHQSHKDLRVIGMTGTLMQNDHKELWNLVDLIQPGYLGSRTEFEAEIAQPIRLARTKTADEAAVAHGDKKREFMSKMSPIFLQRSQEIIADKLPKKEEFVVFCELSPLQKRIYQCITNLPEFALLKKGNAPCDCGVNQEFFVAYKKLRSTKERIEYQRKNKDCIQLMKNCCYRIPTKRNKFGYSEIDPDAILWRYHDGHENEQACDKCPYCILFPALMKLLKVASHAALLQLDRPLQSYTPGTGDYRAALKDFEFAKVAIPPEDITLFPGAGYVRQESIMDNHFILSGKMKMLDKLLKRHSAAGKRVLIFSPSTKSLDLIQNYIKANGYVFLRMDGSIPQPKRQPLIHEYQTNPNIFIFLLSTRATGVGINLTAANVVIIFDCDWNPSSDAQAQDRAYRIGQTNDVEVIRLVSRGTIDELKYIRQIYKEQLKMETIGGADESAPRVFRGVQGDKNRKGELFGCENLMKYKDGSFMDDLWKANDKKTSHKVSDGIAMHSERSFVDVLSKTSLEEIVGLENDLFQSLEQVVCHAPVQDQRSQAKDSTAKDCWNECNDEPLIEQSKAVHHEDFLRGDRGGAALKPGDEGYDEEMGGQSQMIYEVFEQAGGLGTYEPDPAATTEKDAAAGGAARTLIQSSSDETNDETYLLPKKIVSEPSENDTIAVIAATSKNISKAERVDLGCASPPPNRLCPTETANLPGTTGVKIISKSADLSSKNRDAVLARLQSSKRPSPALHQLDLPAYLNKKKKVNKGKDR